MRLLANIVGICVMGAVTYAAVSVFPGTSESVPIWTIIATASFAAIGLFLWQPSIWGSQTPREWAIFFAGSWVLSMVLFILACWLADISWSEAMRFPPVLWEKRGRWWDDPVWSPFYAAMVFGPGVTLLAVGSLVRASVLRLGGSTMSAPSSSNAGTLGWPAARILFFFVVLPLLGIILGSGAWIAHEILVGNLGKGLAYTALWAPLAVVLGMALNKIARVRLRITLGATAFFLAAFVLLQVSQRL
jgi:hypothetical protein